MATQVKSDFSDYDDDGAWPVMIDDFVGWVRGICFKNKIYHNFFSHVFCPVDK